MKILAYLVAFILPLNAFAQVIQSDAVVGRWRFFYCFNDDREYRYLEAIGHICISPKVYQAVVREIAVDGNTGPDIGRRFTPLFHILTRVASGIIIVWGTAYAYRRASLSIGGPQRSIAEISQLGR